MKKIELKNIINFAVLVFLLSVLLTMITLESKADVPKEWQTPNEKILNYGPVGVDGAVLISGLDLVEIGDSLLLAFKVKVSRRAINNRQTWRIVPELSVHETGQYLNMPTLLITGHQKQRHFNRKESFGNRWLMENYPDLKTSITEGTDTVLTYRITVPYEFWMDKAHLTIHQYLASPKEKMQLFSSGSYGMVTLEEKLPYTVQPIVNYIQPGKEVKKRSVGYKALVDFPVGMSRIIPDYRRNPEELSMIDYQIGLIKDSPYIDIQAIYMEGYASPEGSNLLNQRLSIERVEALKKYFVEKHGINANIIHIKNITEDWDGLQVIVETWPEGAVRDKILAVIDSTESPDIKEKRLRALPQWVRLIKEVFPLLRRTEYRIDFMVRDFTVEQTRSLIKSNPEMFSHYELYMLAMSSGDDLIKRLEILEMILRYYPEDDIALNNYAAALLAAGEIPSARRYVDRISEISLAYNNLGLIYMFEGSYDDAQKYFKLSQTDEAVHNLHELQLKIEDNIKMERYNNR